MIKKILLLALTLIAFTNVHAHDDENGITLESKVSSTVNAGKIHYAFDLYDNTNKKNITDTDLTESHEKILHLFIYDSALKEFKHLHPVFTNQEWSVDFDLNTNGKYWIWAQGTLASDGDEFSASEKISIVNGMPDNAIPTSLGDLRTASDEISVATITGKAKVKQSTMLMVKFTRTDGTKAEITDYLGAFAHVVIVPLDGSAIIHAHPMATGKPDEGMLHVTFPKIGDYRVWIQFLDGGKLRTIPLSVKVAN